jgi:hypothetical protein
MSNNSIVLITGGNTGIGYETVKALYASPEAHTIIMGSRSLDKAAEAISTLKSEIPESKSEIVPVQIDIESNASMEAAFKTVESQFGRIDALVNNAGKTKLPLHQSTLQRRLLLTQTHRRRLRHPPPQRHLDLHSPRRLGPRLLPQRHIHPSHDAHLHAAPPRLRHPAPPLRHLGPILAHHVRRRRAIQRPRALRAAKGLAQAARPQRDCVSQQQDGAEYDDAGVGEGCGARRRQSVLY